MKKPHVRLSRIEIQARKDYFEDERQHKIESEMLIVTDRARWVICAQGHVYLATALLERCPGSNALNGKRKMCNRHVHPASPAEVEASRQADCERKAINSCEICSAKHGHTTACPLFKPRVYPKRRARLQDMDRRFEALSVRTFLERRNQATA